MTEHIAPKPYAVERSVAAGRDEVSDGRAAVLTGAVHGSVNRLPAGSLSHRTAERRRLEGAWPSVSRPPQ